MLISMAFTPAIARIRGMISSMSCRWVGAFIDSLVSTMGHGAMLRGVPGLCPSFFKDCSTRSLKDWSVRTHTVALTIGFSVHLCHLY